MSELRSVLDQLAALDLSELDPGDLSDAELLDGMRRLHGVISQATALMTRFVAVSERRQAQRADGMVSMKSWLTGHCRMAGTEAAAMVRAGRRLAELPQLAAAYAEGAVSTAHVDVVTSATTPARLAVAEAAGIDLSTTDRVLTEAARSLGPEDTGRATRRWVIGVDPDGTLDDDAGRRRVFRMAASSGGRVYFSGHADAVGGEIVHTALEAVMNGHRPADDRRTHAERQGDALVELCRQALNGGSLPTVRGERPQVRVSIDLMSLCAERGVGELPFAGPISAGTARRLACDAAVVRVITGPAGLPLDVGRERRTAGAAIRRRSSSATCTASSPDAPHRRPGATSTTSSTGPTEERPRATTAPSCANGTTPLSTRGASRWPVTPAPPSGTPTAPTAPKCWSAVPARERRLRHRPGT